MKIVFHPEAEAEFLAAVDYYEDCKTGLGIDFALEINSTMANILNFPNAWPIFADNLRRCLVNRFPFGIIYTQEENMIFVLAVMHLHRNPEYWKDRLQ
jgi:toxin ParE1/3/4